MNIKGLALDSVGVAPCRCTFNNERLFFFHLKQKLLELNARELHDFDVLDAKARYEAALEVARQVSAHRATACDAAAGTQRMLLPVFLGQRMGLTVP